jgi:NAD(P)-dependent dehydrogenase (short-subunit alcohol dehydrogenase family)
MAVNVRGPMLQLARLSAALRPGASVVITASSSADEGAAAVALYAGSKGALIAMARSWATALAPRGIRVNTLVPGPTGTGFRDFRPAADRESFGQSVLADAGLAVNRVEVMPDGRLILSELADPAPDTRSEADNWFNRKG